MANPNIPMAVDKLDTAAPVNNAATQQTNNALATEQILKQHYDNLDAREKSRLTSTVAGAAQLKSYLDNDDLEGAHSFLVQRRASLHSRLGAGENVDTQETDYALEKLRKGEVDTLKNDINGLMAAGQVYGILGGKDMPSTVQEWQYYNSLAPEDQQRFLNMKRANQTINLGGTQTVLGPDGKPIASYPVTLKPEDQPNNAKEKAKATAQGAAEGEASAGADAKINKMAGLDAAFEALLPSAKAAPNGGIAGGVASMMNKVGAGGEAAVAQGDFSVKRAALENEIRQAFRVAGSGATSDRDALPFIQMLPDENDSEVVKVAKIKSAQQAVRATTRTLALQRNLPDPFETGAAPQGGGQPAQGGLVKVTNAQTGESFMIDPSDLAAAEAEGFTKQ